ncbi:alpha/beta hydrolase [Mycobacterium barrassiae]|uniref:alpha/beta fold hydrolase n=1 Tax=Mycobacterium barrassiae TaxID=319709 RepID=UPI002265B608|nr:alpha/beta hydrolase [Mycobacterium barrassiae]MCV7301670.1 alpha/beta hydrolase [Mycobacterium barrassiae]
MAADAGVAHIATADGRRLAYLQVGDPDGPLVIHNHGGPSSRLEVRLLEGSATRNGIRLIGVDRPGMGQSSPQKAQSYSGWADDLVAIADALGFREFGVTGWSEGGPWALAAAAYIDPDRLRHVSSIAPGSYGAFGDNSAAQYLSKIDALGGTLALIQRPDIGTAFGESVAECFAHGSDGLVRDAELLYRHWAFDVAKIERPVHLWQGLDDKLVPDPINKAVADAMPGAIWHPVEEAGHFIAVGAGDDIFAIAAEELRA